MTDFDHAENRIEWTQLHSLYDRSNLTRLQLLYWLGQNLRPVSPLLNNILVFRIFGEIDEERFQMAFQATLEHSDALRTVINEINGVPQRRVSAEFKYCMDFIDISRESEPESAYQAWLQKRCIEPFRLDECLFDAALVKISNANYVWYLNQHHLVTDASSAFLVFERLVKFYKLSLDGEPLSWPGLPQFEDYVKYERLYRSSPQYKKAEVYWQKKLSPGPEAMRYFGRPSVRRTTKVEMVSHDLGPTLSKEIRAVTNRREIFTVSEDLSLYNFFVTLFFIQIHQLSGNYHLGLVTPVHNRFSMGLKNTVGLLMELCPYQLEISKGDTFLSLLDKVKRETRETMTHYQYGSGLTFRNETFDVMFNTHQMPVFNLGDSKVRVERIHPGHGSESLALHVIDNKSSDSFLLNFYFHTDVFDEHQREQIIQSYSQLLSMYLGNTNKSVDDASPISWTTGSKGDLKRTDGGDLERSPVKSGLPQDLLEYKLIETWEEILGVKPIGVQDNFFDLGGNSWTAAQLIVRIEKLTGQYLPLTTLLQLGTISELAQGIRREMGKTLWSTVIRIQAGDNKQPLFCVPGAGGNGLAISRIASHMEPSRPVYMFQIPLQDENDKAPFSTIEEMAAHYVDALLAYKPEGPYLLAGYSAGGLVAFEVAQQLQRKGCPVEMLAIIDVPAQGPTYKYLRSFTRWINQALKKDQNREIDQYIYWRDILFRLNYFLRLGYWEWLRRGYMRIRRRIRGILSFVHLVQEQQFEPIENERGGNIHQAGQANIPNIHNSRNVEEGDLAWQSQDRYMRRYFEINNIAVKLYMPDVYPGRIILFKSKEGYRYPEMRSPERLLGWGRIARDGVEMYELPGNHMDIVREPSVRLLGEQLEKCLDGLSELN